MDTKKLQLLNNYFTFLTKETKTKKKKSLNLKLRQYVKLYMCVCIQYLITFIISFTNLEVNEYQKEKKIKRNYQKVMHLLFLSLSLLLSLLLLFLLLYEHLNLITFLFFFSHFKYKSFSSCSSSKYIAIHFYTRICFV